MPASAHPQDAGAATIHDQGVPTTSTDTSQAAAATAAVQAVVARLANVTTAATASATTSAPVNATTAATAAKATGPATTTATKAAGNVRVDARNPTAINPVLRLLRQLMIKIDLETASRGRGVGVVVEIGAGTIGRDVDRGGVAPGVGVDGVEFDGGWAVEMRVLRLGVVAV